MKILINESQFVILLTESKYKPIKDELKNSIKVSNSIIKEVSQDTKMNLTMLTTWGAGVAGFIGPLNNFLMTSEFNLTKQDAALIACAVSAIVYNARKAETKKLIQLVYERGLEKEYLEALSEAKELKKSFVSLLKSLNIAALESSKIISYTFLIPIIPILLDISNSTPESAKQIASRIVASMISLGAGQLTKEILTNLISRFKEK